MNDGGVWFWFIALILRCNRMSMRQRQSSISCQHHRHYRRTVIQQAIHPADILMCFLLKQSTLVRGDKSVNCTIILNGLFSQPCNNNNDIFTYRMTEIKRITELFIKLRAYGPQIVLCLYKYFISSHPFYISISIIIVPFDSHMWACIMCESETAQ